MKLPNIITGTQTVELIEPRNADSHYLRSLRLLLRDNATGALTELTIEADMLAIPEEATLVWSVMDIDEPVMRHDHGEFVDDGQSVVTDEVAPDFGWRVAIDGTETDTRIVAGGLF